MRFWKWIELIMLLIDYSGHKQWQRFLVRQRFCASCAKPPKDGGYQLVFRRHRIVPVKGVHARIACAVSAFHSRLGRLEIPGLSSSQQGQICRSMERDILVERNLPDIDCQVEDLLSAECASTLDVD